MTICLITKTIRMMTVKMKTTRYLIDQERGEIRRHRHSDRRKINETKDNRREHTCRSDMSRYDY